MKKIVFLGMGLMGSRMATRLLAAGYDVAVWNRTPSACQPLLEKGATQLANFSNISQYDVLMLCVSDDTAVQAIAENIKAHVQAGQVLVDFSSITANTTKSLANRFAQKQVSWLDIPVSGGVQGAQAGTLVMFAGGNESQVNKLRPLLACLSARVTYMGASGAGQVTKLCNQLIVAANSTLIAEAVALAEASGVDTTQLAPALAGGFADSKPFQILAPRMATHCFTPVQWKVATLHKDLCNAVAQAESVGVSLSVAKCAQATLSEQNQTRGQADLSSIILGVSN